MGIIAELIGRYRAEILGAWSEAARQAASARKLTPAQLESLIPEFLSQLGRDAPDPDARLSPAQLALIERHLSNRLREGFNLNEILTELAVLGRCISKFLEVEGDVRPSVAEVAGLYAELYQTATAVSRIFNEHVLEDEQTMKRYARLLDHVANAPLAFHDASAPLLERLHEALALISDAMGGCSAALLLLDGSGDGRPTTAAVGRGAAELAQLARSNGAAIAGAPRGERASEAGEVEITEPLRQRGVGSLLRVKLAADDTLRCVLYVGIEEVRPFTASEVRRFEGLSRSLAVHLDNAHLRAALRAQEHELRSERELRERVVAVLVREVRGPLAAARASALRLGSDPPGLAAATLAIVDTLGRVLQTVDEFLGTTAAAAADRVL